MIGDSAFQIFGCFGINKYCFNVVGFYRGNVVNMPVYCFLFSQMAGCSLGQILLRAACIIIITTLKDSPFILLNRYTKRLCREDF